MPPYNSRHLTEGRQQLTSPIRERVSEITEQPRTAEAAAADHYPVGAALAHHRQRVGSLPDVTVAEYRDGDGLLERGDGLPIRAAGIGLLRRTTVQGNGGTT